MARKIRVDDVEYVYDDLQDAAKSVIHHLDFINKNITHLKNMQAVMQRAKNSYMEELKKEMLAHKAGFLIQEDD